MEEWRYREMYEIEDRHWWFQSRRIIVRALLHQAGVDAPRRILDAGCGTGRNLLDYAGLGTAEGVDFSAEAVRFCHDRGLTEVRQAALEDLPFEDGRFDLVVATDVIEHLPDDRAALAELRRVTTAGGTILVTVPAYQWLWSGHDVSLHHFRRYTAGRMRAQMVASGWRPAHSTYFFSTMLPAVAAVRALRSLRSRSDGASDLELSPEPLTRALRQPAIVEAGLIRRGVRLPAGVSLGFISRQEPEALSR